MARYAISLGSNLGDSMATLRAAVAALAEEHKVTEVSPLYVTDPVGGPAQDRFLNAVVVLDAPISPNELLQRLQAIEARLGRVRDVRWGPRTLDLDIIATDQPPTNTSELVVPHPRGVEREFVLRPLCDVWPEAVVGSMTAVEALARLAPQGVELRDRDWLEFQEP